MSCKSLLCWFKTMIQKHVSWQKPQSTPFILFIHSISVSWDSSVASEWKCKAGGTQEMATLPRPRCKTGHSSLWSPPEGLTDLRRHTQGFVWKQTTECAMWSAGPCWAERERTSRRWFDAVSLSIWATLWGFEFLSPSRSWRKGVHQRSSYDLALLATDATHTLPFISLTARASQNRLQTRGQGCTIWAMRYV